MSAVNKGWLPGAIGAAALLLQACAVEGGGVDTTVGVGYYEPYGYEYGGWGGGYRVGPGRGGDGRGGDGRGGGGRGGGGRGGGPQHGYRAAPSSRSMPSIPSHARGGGHH